jgi:hypothetical protein
VLSVGLDRMLRRSRDGVEQASFAAPGYSDALAAAFSRSAEAFAYAPSPGTLHVIDAATGATTVYGGYEGALVELAYALDGTLYGGSITGEVLAFADGRTRALARLRGPVHRIATASGCSALAAATARGDVALWPRPHVAPRLWRLPVRAEALSLAPDGDRLAVLLRDGRVLVYDATGRQLMALRATDPERGTGGAPAFARRGYATVAFTADGALLAYVNPGQRRLRSWRLADGEELVDLALATEYADEIDTRRRTLRARYGRAMAENGELIREVLALRIQIAELLGYQHWADLRTAANMAGTGATALAFLTDLGERLGDRFHAEQLVLRDLKRAHVGDPSLGVEELERADIRFYTRQLMARDYQIDVDALRSYFPEGPTLRGIFDVYEQLFDLRITVRDAFDAWADDVRVAEIEDVQSGELLGAVYLDLHPRAGKYTHFAMFGLVDGRLVTAGEYRAPICAIVGNFPLPVGETPSLWSFDQVTTMFHELGHALHHVLTTARFAAFAGINVPLDYVEVPSQMLERWLEDIRVVGSFAVHHETGEVLPAASIEALGAASRATIGHFYKRQLSWGLSDLRIHMYTGLEQLPGTADAIYGATNADYATYYAVSDDSAPLASFGHLFGGYDAGYYGYAWADAISADLAGAFRASAQGFMDHELGQRFRQEILEVGNERDPGESIRAFLGRDWNTDAFFDELLGTPSVPCERE